MTTPNKTPARLDADSTAEPLYWRARMAERMSKRDEVSRLVTVLKGFYLDERGRYATLGEFYHNAKRPYGNKGVEESIAFNLGWDRDRVLCESAMPAWVEAEAMELHRLVGEEIGKTAPVTLAPSEVALAKVLAAYQKGDWSAVGDALYAACLLGNGKDEFGLSTIGQALLERARKEGVL